MNLTNVRPKSLPLSKAKGGGFATPALPPRASNLPPELRSQRPFLFPPLLAGLSGFSLPAPFRAPGSGCFS